MSFKSVCAWPLSPVVGVVVLDQTKDHEQTTRKKTTKGAGPFELCGRNAVAGACAVDGHRRQTPRIPVGKGLLGRRAAEGSVEGDVCHVPRRERQRGKMGQEGKDHGHYGRLCSAAFDELGTLESVKDSPFNARPLD